MRRLLQCLTVTAMITAACVLPQSAAAADVFIDFDGDGIDDNLVDFKDGFFLAEGQSATTTMTGAQVIDFSAFVDDDAPVELPQTPKEAFTSRRFNARLISQCRLDLDADFDGGSASGSSSSGSHCVGGVCY